MKCKRKANDSEQEIQFVPKQLKVVLDRSTVAKYFSLENEKENASKPAVLDLNDLSAIEVSDSDDDVIFVKKTKLSPKSKKISAMEREMRALKQKNRSLERQVQALGEFVQPNIQNEIDATNDMPPDNNGDDDGELQSVLSELLNDDWLEQQIQNLVGNHQLVDVAEEMDRIINGDE